MTGKDVEEKVGVKGIGQDLEEGVKGHEACGQIPVAVGEIVPDQDHGDTAGKAHQDDPHHVVRMIRKKEHREHEHHHRPHHPVLDEGEGEHAFVGKDHRKLLVPYLGQRGIHHQDESDGDGNGGGPHLETLDKPGRPRDQFSEEHPEGHGHKDPQGKVAVKKAHLFASHIASSSRSSFSRERIWSRTRRKVSGSFDFAGSGRGR